MPVRVVGYFLFAVILLTACAGTARSSGHPSVPTAAPARAAAPSAAAAKEKIVISYPSAGIDALPSMVAKDQGFFEQNGVDVDVVAIGAGSQPDAALMANQIQVLLGGE